MKPTIFLKETSQGKEAYRGLKELLRSESLEHLYFNIRRKLVPEVPFVFGPVTITKVKLNRNKRKTKS